MGRFDTFKYFAKLSFQRSLSTMEQVNLILDVLFERMLYGTELQDYFQYEFYKLKNRERRKYMTYSKLRYTMKVCNNPSKREFFDDKVIFNKTFSEYLFRDWLDVTEASYEDFFEFIQKNPTIFAKARSGMFGKNARRYDADTHKNDVDTKKLYEKLKDNGCIIEQVITQHPSLDKFNQTSVNTLRIVTLLCADGSPKVMAGVLRIGRSGKTADNFHHYGIAATIDVDTGIVNSPGIDRGFKRYIVHPDSGERIIGYEIPSWEKVVDIVSRAALVVPDVRYIGWDVAIDSDGNTQLIEGNYGADPDVIQMPCRIGKWHLFDKELKKITN